MIWNTAHLSTLRSPGSPPTQNPQEHPPSTAAVAEGSTGNREVQGQTRGVLGNCFVPISTNC